MEKAISAGQWRASAPPPQFSRRFAGSRCLFLSPNLQRATITAAASRADHMFVFGMGFVGRHVADQLKREGWHVCGTCRSADKKRELMDMGFDTFIFDVNKSELGSLPTLQQATHVLISIPPIASIGDPLLFLHKDLHNKLTHGNLQWLCYLSSTSVYGDCGGAWVDEDSPVNPNSDSAKSRYAAEKGWLDMGIDLGVVVNILRLGGIYGPGRSALDTMVKQKPLSIRQMKREYRLYTARIHVADIYQAIKASFNMLHSGKYNVVDDDPAPRKEVFAFAQDLVKKRWPDIELEFPSDEGDNVHIEQGKMGGEKRVSNARMKKELGVNLLYPNYRLGLQSIMDSWGSHPYPQ